MRSQPNVVKPKMRDRKLKEMLYTDKGHQSKQA